MTSRPAKPAHYAADLRNELAADPAKFVTSEDGYAEDHRRFHASERIRVIARNAAKAAAHGERDLRYLAQTSPVVAAAVIADGDNSKEAIQRRLLARRAEIATANDEQLAAMTDARSAPSSMPPSCLGPTDMATVDIADTLCDLIEQAVERAKVARDAAWVATQAADAASTEMKLAASAAWDSAERAYAVVMTARAVYGVALDVQEGRCTRAQADADIAELTSELAYSLPGEGTPS